MVDMKSNLKRESGNGNLQVKETARIEDIPLANWCRTITRSAIQDMLVVASRPGILSFALGLPAAELFPTKDYAQAVQHVLSTNPRALQYEPPFQALKTHIVALMAQRGVVCREEQIFLTTGAQQGMNLLARLFVNPGERVLLEEIAYPGIQQVIMSSGAHVLTVPTDGDSGINVDAVESLLRNGARPAFIYTIPDGHNPLSVSMTRGRRQRLVELAREYHMPVVEDDAYGFLSYDRTPEPPMRALDENWVCYIGSFSKILAPGLRVGWMVVPEQLLTRLSVAKEASDIDTATLSQRTIAAYLAAGHLPDHLAQLRHAYRERRDAMIGALQAHFPAETRWSTPNNGMFLWVTCPDGVDTGELLKIAIEQEQVAFVPGIAFSVNQNPAAARSMRLNFSNCSPERIEQGIERLARALKKLTV